MESKITSNGGESTVSTGATVRHRVDFRMGKNGGQSTVDWHVQMGITMPKNSVSQKFFKIEMKLR